MPLRYNSDELETFPPIDARLIDPNDKIETPIDDRGLVDVSKLIEVVKETVNPDYDWPGKSGIHHFYWPESDYPHDSRYGAIANPAAFRQLPLHKGLIPKVFENWLHAITIPPAKPEPEVMEYRIEAWKVAESLFLSVQQAVQWERKARRRAIQIAEKPETLRDNLNGVDVIGEEIIQEILDHHFRGAQQQMERLEQIPSEYRLIDPKQSQRELATQVGQLVIHRRMRPQVRDYKTKLAKAS